jgi:hypothetical protein
VRNVPATIQVNDPTPGTFVLITPNPYNKPTPPVVDMTANNPVQAWAQTVGSEGTAIIPVPPGTYYVTCWIQKLCTGRLTYRPTYSANQTAVTAGQTNVPVSCGAPPVCP